jgi:conjugal transfer pilus assembly protein TraK
MKFNALCAALIWSCGFSAFAQTGEPLHAPAPAKAKSTTMLMIRKDAPAPVKAVKQSLASKEPVEGVLKSPLAKPKPKILALALPGLGVMPGETSDLKIKTVQVGTDRNELVYISLTQLNKIATPFEAPQAIDSAGATLKTVGQDLYLLPANDKPLTVYISDGGTGQSIGLTLVPKANLSAQSIVLQPDARVASARAKSESDESVPSDYVARINAMIKQLALGKTPTGFTKSKLPRAVAAGTDLVIEPQYKYAGSTYDLFSYKATSKSASPLEMREESFYSEVVRAVAFFPNALLQQGEETMVFVIADRAVKGQ